MERNQSRITKAEKMSSNSDVISSGKASKRITLEDLHDVNNRLADVMKLKERSKNVEH